MILYHITLQKEFMANQKKEHIEKHQNILQVRGIYILILLTSFAVNALVIKL